MYNFSIKKINIYILKYDVIKWQNMEIPSKIIKFLILERFSLCELYINDVSGVGISQIIRSINNSYISQFLGRHMNDDLCRMR